MGRYCVPDLLGKSHYGAVSLQLADNNVICVGQLNVNPQKNNNHHRKVAYMHTAGRQRHGKIMKAY